MEQHRIEIERRALGMSRRELAKRLGVSHVMVWRWETQGIHPELDILLKLSDLFGGSAIELDPSLAVLIQPTTPPDPAPELLPPDPPASATRKGRAIARRVRPLAGEAADEAKVRA